MSFLINVIFAVSTFLAAAGIAINGWWVIVIFLALVVVISLLVLGNRQTPSIPPIASASHGHGYAEPGTSGVAEQVEIAEIPLLDDLTKIEGIGPKIATLLSEEGINTFQELANADTDILEQILDEARLAFIDPSTWPEQAHLANLQEWDALAKLQSELKGGRTGS